MSKHQVTLEVSMHKEKETLHIDYVVKNEEATAVYITDVFLDRSGGAIAIAHNIIPMEAEVGKILFKPRLASAGSSITSYAPPSTYARKLMPGKTYRGEFLLTLPLNVVDRNAKMAIQNDLVFKKASFELGIIPDSAKLSATPQTIGGEEVYLLNQQAWNLQFVLSAEINNVEIPLVIRNY